MNKTLLLVLFPLVFLLGCESTTESPKLPDNVVEISYSELEDYWLELPSKAKRYNGRPDFLPPGRGEGFYTITIDSSGEVVAKVLVGSKPTGWLKQKHVDKMPTKQYVASDKNPNKTPVKVVLSFSVLPKAEIGQ